MCITCVGIYRCNTCGADTCVTHQLDTCNIHNTPHVLPLWQNWTCITCRKYVVNERKATSKVQRVYIEMLYLQLPMIAGKVHQCKLRWLCDGNHR